MQMCGTRMIQITQLQGLQVYHLPPILGCMHVTPVTCWVHPCDLVPPPPPLWPKFDCKTAAELAAGGGMVYFEMRVIFVM